MPALIHLFTTAKVLRAVYRITTTTLVLFYIGKRVVSKDTPVVYERARRRPY